MQPHHITYEPEWVVAVFKGEHFSITKMLRRKRVSQGFLIALTDFIEEHKEKAEVLELPAEKIQEFPETVEAVLHP